MEQKIEKYNFFVNGLMFKHGIVIKNRFYIIRGRAKHQWNIKKGYY